MKENRKEIWDSLPSENRSLLLERTMCVYNRYFEANHVVDELKKQKIDFSKIKALDFGCACGDYGITLARSGATSDYHDVEEAAMDLAAYRCSLENLPHKKVVDYSMSDYNLVIFGEVLEHIDDPLELLQKCKDANVNWILTSSYPYRSDDPEESYWKKEGHTEAARLAQIPCRALLESNYNYIRFDGQLRLWTKRASI